MGNSVAVDMGPLYLEIVVFLPGQPDPSISCPSDYSEGLDGTFYFTLLEKSKFLEFKESLLFGRIPRDPTPITLTGLRYDNFQQTLSESYGIPTDCIESTQCTLRSIDFLWKTRPSLFYYFQNAQAPVFDGVMRISEEYFTRTQVSCESLYPYLLVNIRTGISIHHVKSATESKRVGGSSIGSSTFWALMKQFIEDENPLEALKKSLAGDHTEVDSVVRDIYGTGCEGLGLPGDLIASSCGKLRAAKQHSFKTEDIGKSLLCLMLFNLSQLAFMHAEVEGITNIVMTGNVPNDPTANMMLQFCMNYWSGGNCFPIFIDAEPFLGAYGGLLKNLGY